MQFDLKVGIQQLIALITALFSVAAAYFTLQTDIKLQKDQNARQESAIELLQQSQSQMQNTLWTMKNDLAIIAYQLQRRTEEKK